MNALFTRRSVRVFDSNKSISDEELIQIVKAAFYAPSAKRQKLAEFLILSDKDKINELSTIAIGAKILLNADKAIVVLGKTNEHTSALPMLPQDLAAATQNILLQATSLYIGSCWIGVHPIEERQLLAQDILKIDTNTHFVFSIVALGYPKSNDVFYDNNSFDVSKIYFNEVK